MDSTLSLEVQLVAALRAGDQPRAEQLAASLHAQGFDATALAAALADHPELEAQLYAVLQAVIPLSRRAAKRRAIRAAEARDWGDWDDAKRSV
ncbi:MAG: hypothetical protein AB4911_14365 [Oscillochloridaceae bacterium umkhey_bin13]